MSIIKNLFITGIGFFAGMAAAKNTQDDQYETPHHHSHHCNCHNKEGIYNRYKTPSYTDARVEPKIPGFSDRIVETELGTLTMKSDTSEIVVKGVVDNAQRFSKLPIEANNPQSWMNKASDTIKQTLKENGIEPRSFRIEWIPDKSKPDKAATCDNDISPIPSRSEEVCKSPSRDEERVDLKKGVSIVDEEKTDVVTEDKEKREPVVDKRDHSSITLSDKAD